MTEMKLGWWKVDFSITLEGEEVRFSDLSETTQEHIAEKIKEGYVAGQIVEEDEIDEDEEEDEETIEEGDCKSCSRDCAHCAR
jgi:hypothetical protein